MKIAIPTNNVGNTNEVPKRSQNSIYCKYVKNAGFEPILIPMETTAEIVAEMCDGLLLPGGIDIDPLYYGFSNSFSLGVDPEKDQSERELFHSFRNKEKPIFGICRGFQLIFRELLSAHKDKERYKEIFDYMENISGHTQTENLNVPRRFPSHQVMTNVNSLYNKKIEEDGFKFIPVNSMHHQAVTVDYVRATKIIEPKTGNSENMPVDQPYLLDIYNVELISWSLRGVKRPEKNKKPDYDNYWAIVEAAKIHNWGGKIMGVQWHPEELNDVKLIKNFFNSNEEILMKEE